MNKIMKFLREHKICLFIISILYLSNDTLIFGTNSNHILLYIHYSYIILLLLVIFLLALKKKKMNSKMVFIFILLLLLSTLTMIFNKTTSIKFFYEVALISLSLLITNIITFDKFKIEFINAMTIVAILSFIPFLLNIIYQPILRFFPNIINSGGYNYHNLFIGVVPHNYYLFNIYRNQSFFREPGVFGCLLSVSLLFSLFSEKNKKNNKKNIILILAVISTMSTGAILGTFLIILFYFLTTKVSSKKLPLLFIVIIFIFALLNSKYLSTTVFGKINASNASYYSRVSSISSNLAISFDKPILGDGWENIEKDYENESSKRYGMASSHGEEKYHNANTLLKILAIHGYIFFGLYCMGLYLFLKKIGKKRIIGLLLLILLFILLSYEDLSLNIILPLLVFYGFSYRKEVANENS